MQGGRVDTWRVESVVHPLHWIGPGAPTFRSAGVNVRTTAIIAAYNEENTIADVLRALTASPLIDEVIVVSDGSDDRTVEICRGVEGVRTIALRENHGKGFAMAVGVANASNSLLFFCDGDMYNVTSEHIEALITPVLRGEADMNIGIRDRGPFANFMHLK